MAILASVTLPAIFHSGEIESSKITIYGGVWKTYRKI